MEARRQMPAVGPAAVGVPVRLPAVLSAIGLATAEALAKAGPHRPPGPPGPPSPPAPPLPQLSRYRPNPHFAFPGRRSLGRRRLHFLSSVGPAEEDAFPPSRSNRSNPVKPHF